MGMVQCIKNYFQFISSAQFAKYEKDFARGIECALCDCYNKGFHETDVVKAVEDRVNSIDDLSTPDGKSEISSKAIFTHGSKSQVIFDCYNKKSAQRELGDLIFIIAIVYNGKKYVERMTITQFKKDSGKPLTWGFNSKSSKEQLYLLSRFPAFKGVGKGSLIRQKKYHLTDYSGCLGSYGMLHTPGDFVFVGAPRFESCLGSKKSIKINDLLLLCNVTDSYCPINCLLQNGHCMRRGIPPCLVFLSDNVPVPFHCMQPLGLFGNCTYAQHVYDFTDKYLRLLIGEFTYFHNDFHNSGAKDLLQDLIEAISKKAEKEKDKPLADFAKDFLKTSYSDNSDNKEVLRRDPPDFDIDGGGFGIVYTTINVGKGD